MRSLVLLLLLPSVPIRGDDAQLREPRAWRGRVSARAISDEPDGGSGREEQTERAEFVLVTEPPRVTLVAPRLEFRMRESDGAYALRIDTREPGAVEGTSVVTKGASEGRLHLHAEGALEPEAGRYRLALRAEPDRVVALTTMSGVEDGRFRTLRHAESRRSLLASFVAEGEVEADGRTIRGERKTSDTVGARRREVLVTWTLVRVDPAISGRVADHRGRPLEGLKVLARTTNAERVRRRLPPILLEGTTDASGRFRIDAYHAPWRIEILGACRDAGSGPLVVVGRELDAAAHVRFEEAPELDVALEVYRLDALPQPALLDRSFAGDVKRYLEFVRARHPVEELNAALSP